MELRITITVAEHGYDEENGERFLEGFLETHPEAGPSVSQNLRTGELSVTFSADVDDVFAASDVMREIFTSGANASGLALTEIVNVHADVVGRERATRREAIPV